MALTDATSTLLTPIFLTRLLRQEYCAETASPVRRPHLQVFADTLVPTLGELRQGCPTRSTSTATGPVCKGADRDELDRRRLLGPRPYPPARGPSASPPISTHGMGSPVFALRF